MSVQVAPVAVNTSLTFFLSLPPSLNHMYTTVNGNRVKSAEARIYAVEVGLAVRTMNRGVAKLAIDPTKSLLKIDIVFHFETLFRRDIDGGIKALQDSVCKALDINDNRVVDLHVYKVADRDSPHAAVTVTVLP